MSNVHRRDVVCAVHCIHAPAHLDVPLPPPQRMPRLSTVMNADNIAVMDKGRLVEQGTHDNLMGMGGVYSSLVARQVRGLTRYCGRFSVGDLGF